MIESCHLAVSGVPILMVGVHFQRPLGAIGRRDRGGPRVLRDESFEAAARREAASLPLRFAVAVWLVDVCGCTYEEAAQELRVGPRTIARRVARGRRSIRQRLAYFGAP